MQLFNPNFGLYLLILLSLTYVSFITGSFILSFSQNNISSHIRLSLNVIIGYIFWITISAAFFTKGNTILIIIPIISLIYVILFRVKIKLQRNPIKAMLNETLWLLKPIWFLLFIYALFTIKHIVANGVIEFDYLFYSNVAYTMLKSGVEGIMFGMFNAPKIHPYHYGDIWITSLISKIFNTNYWHTTVFISMPYLLFMAYVAAVSLIEELGKKLFNKSNMKFAYFLAAIILVISSLEYPILNKHIEGTLSLIQWPKQGVIYIMYTLALIFLLQKKHQLAFLAIILLVPLYFTTSLFILPSTGILIIILLFNKKKEGWKYLTILLLTVSGTALFYLLNSSFTDTTTSGSITLEKVFKGISIFPDQFLKKSIRYSFIYIPFFILLVLQYYNGNLKITLNRLIVKSSIKIVVIFLLSGFILSMLLGSTLSATEQDFMQLFYNGANPLLALISFIIIVISTYKLFMLKEKKYFISNIILLIIITAGVYFQHYKHPRYWGNIEKFEIDEDFYLKLDKEIKDNDRIATFQYFENKPGRQNWAYYYKLYPLVPRLANFKFDGAYRPECINVNEMDTVNKPKRQNLYNYSAFILYMDSVRNFEPEITPGKAQSMFLQDKSFDFVILPSDYTMPKEIKTMVSDSIIDRVQGNRVFKLSFAEK